MRKTIHSAELVRRAGVPLEKASAAMLLIHGRGASAEDILSLAGEFTVDGMAYLAPQATNGTWYPQSFMAPLEANEPYLSSALDVVDALVEQVALAGVPFHKLVLLGFSQGACVTLEYAARNARRYGAVIGLSGGLIGPDGTPRTYAGSFEGTPIYLGCSDIDPHIPLHRVYEAETVLSTMGAHVSTDIFKGGPHAVYREEINRIAAILNGLAIHP